MKSAVLVIDVQRGLFDDAPRPDQADAVIQRINALTARARSAGVPVAFIQHERAAAPLLYQSDSWALVDQLQTTEQDARIRKTTPDSFLNTELAHWLTAQGVQRIVICGYATEFCVDTTVRRAAALGYQVVLAADAHTTHDKAHASAEQIRVHHNATLPNITSFGVAIRAEASAEVVFAAC